VIKTLNSLQPYGAFILRIALGVSMIVHGYEKVIPHGALHGFETYVHSLGIPAWLGIVSAYTEFVGGILILMGLLTRLAALFIAINMLVALITVGIHQGFGIYNYIFALLAIAVMLVFYGPGALAVNKNS
jgi:putative oxidoreductase